MAVDLDNLDEIIGVLAKLETSVELEVIRDARKRMRATVRKYIPIYKKVSPKRSGDLIKSIKVKSRSKRGISRVELSFLVSYAGFANFTKNIESDGFASDQYKKDKDALERQGRKDVRESFEATFNRLGINFE